MDGPTLVNRELPSLTEAYSAVTRLIITNLPEKVLSEDLEKSLRGFGGTISVKRFQRGRLRRCAFVSCDSLPVASRIVRALNGAKLHGRQLKVEYAQESKNTPSESKVRQSLKIDKSQKQDEESTKETSASSSAIPYEPLNPELGFHFPLSPSLEYLYPPPSPLIISNIAGALLAVPRFYTQVVHLMNKMNLPPPFGPELAPNAPAPSDVLEPSQFRIEKGRAISRSLMSEEERQEEELMAGLDEKSRKRVREGMEILPEAVSISEEGEKVSKKKKGETVVHLKSKTERAPAPPAAVTAVGTAEARAEGQELEKEPEHAPTESAALTGESERFGVTDDFLQKNKLSPEEIAANPKFSTKYNQGVPSNVLYARNLSKSVEEEELFALFGRKYSSLESAKESLQVSRLSFRLMSTGTLCSYDCPSDQSH